ncbi:hypothetical protein ACRASX_16320 (plasmid) [Flavobacterium sp. TMP13]|uniref:hypothetical protein n=1 Tax=Flavobacterium sp. TMP13 TaxID=3425950 RepID=UPI003D78A4EE
MNQTVIFDTLDKEYFKIYPLNTSVLTPLNHSEDKPDVEYLKQFFPKGHMIFIYFSNAYFYTIQEDFLEAACM